MPPMRTVTTTTRRPAAWRSATPTIPLATDSSCTSASLAHLVRDRGRQLGGRLEHELDGALDRCLDGRREPHPDLLDGLGLAGDHHHLSRPATDVAHEAQHALRVHRVR